MKFNIKSMLKKHRNASQTAAGDVDKIRRSITDLIENRETVVIALVPLEEAERRLDDWLDSLEERADFGVMVFASPQSDWKRYASEIVVRAPRAEFNTLEANM